VRKNLDTSSAEERLRKHLLIVGNNAENSSNDDDHGGPPRSILISGNIGPHLGTKTNLHKEKTPTSLAERLRASGPKVSAASRK
jgi:hypothetical protein